jgi:hypothetical protein
MNERVPTILPDPTRFNVTRDILPLFVAEERGGTKVDLVSFEGTAFVVAPSVIVTCWHCVRRPLTERQAYAVGLGQMLYPLTEVQQDPRGLDLAIARVDGLVPSLGLRLAEDEDVLQGQEVMAYGFPLGQVSRGVHGAARPDVASRVLHGYITRRFVASLPGFISTLSLEIDMPAPAGLSGAPVIVRGRRPMLLGGVVYGANAVAQIEELAQSDPATGFRTPEVQRIVTFAAAHMPDSLRDLRGAATGGRRLADLLL